MRIRVVDFESTGLPADDKPSAIVEVGWWDVEHDPVSGWSLDYQSYGAHFVSTPVPVEIEARATHHITDADIAAGLPVTLALRHLTENPPDYWCAHNAGFERHFFSGGDVPWIDTYKVALRAWPDAPSHSNQALRYWRGLDDLPSALAMPPHRAGPDAYVTAHLLIDLLTFKPAPVAGLLKRMVAISAEPALQVRVGFGKHFGKPWQEVEGGYLEWILKQDMDEDVKFTARHHLKLMEAA